MTEFEGRNYDSQAEIEFVRLARRANWNITNYGDREYEIIANTFPTPSQDPTLQGYLKRVAYHSAPMRKPERAVYTPDFHIEIDGKEYIVEVKGKWKASKGITHKESEEHISYQLRKTLFLSKHKCNFLEFVFEGKMNFTCLYYHS